ncbi:biotin--[acetyl-CoA-carboxylase] ligase [Christiangramia aquimixticola]|uniref:biotin--[acetyl-CoA-carboxylase] ligase n=1 Tax=Christiangramia aquimixticola TaxID=1697558 RepID=UPI003AA87720
MRIIKVDAIDSTNSFVRKFYEGASDFSPVCVRAIHQTAGRGQRGSNWEVKPGQNLTFSILYPQSQLEISKYFLLSASISLAILKVFRQLNIPQLKVKWPNDIMSSKKKVGGILIENIIKNDGIAASIIGVGINVNQTEFHNLPQASSLKLATGNSYDLDEILEILIPEIDTALSRLSTTSEEILLKKYQENMFMLDKVTVFQKPNSDKLNGIIKGVTPDGKLLLKTEDDKLEEFGLKEIQLLY